jgi:hypothetical protein
MRKSLRLATAGLIVATAFAQDTDEDSRLPGTIRFEGVSESQTVLLDGERVASGTRTVKELLIAPGTYVVTFVDSKELTACNTRVQVRENGVTTARCTIDAGRRLAD